MSYLEDKWRSLTPGRQLAKKQQKQTTLLACIDFYVVILGKSDEELMSLVKSMAAFCRKLAEPEEEVS